MTNKELEQVRKISSKYEEKGEPSDFEKLKKLDKSIKIPANVFGYTFGTAGALILGVGMCSALGALSAIPLPFGIVIGVVGIAMTVSNYFIYKALLNASKKRHAKEVLDLTSALLNQKCE